MASLGGISLALIAGSFAFEIFASPILGGLPLFVILIIYGGGANLPFRFPAALAAALLGLVLAWTTYAMGLDYFAPPDKSWSVSGQWWPFPWGLHLQNEASREADGSLPPSWPLFNALVDGRMWGYAPIIVPLALQNVVGDFANTEVPTRQTSRNGSPRCTDLTPYRLAGRKCGG